MVSCIEFIPMYSELMKFIDHQGGGKEAVYRYWKYIGGDSVRFNLEPLAREKGMDGAWEYWTRSLSEEACDIKYVYDREHQEIRSHMRHCPSKGHLLEYTWMEPYEHYCDHCTVVYQEALNDNGINMIMDLSCADHAECRGVLHRLDREPGKNWTTVVDEETQGPEKLIMDITAEDNKYLHRDFHVAADGGLRYVAEQYGANGVRQFLETFVKAFYQPLFEAYQKDGLKALMEHQQKLYEAEEMPDVFHAELSGDENLTITIDRCPAVTFMKEHNYTPSRWYIELTRTVSMVMADVLDLGFSLEYYNEKDGACKYCFFRRSF